MHGLQSKEEQKNALATLEQVRKRDPNHPLTSCFTGAALGALERFEEALAPYEQAIHLEPNDAAASNGTGEVLLKLESSEEAKPRLSKSAATW